jgi:hypothetical protein
MPVGLSHSRLDAARLEKALLDVLFTADNLNRVIFPKCLAANSTATKDRPRKLAYAFSSNAVSLDGDPVC